MDALEQKFTLHVPSSTQNLALIREFVGRIGQQAGLDDNDVSKLELAVDEACTNAIEHAHAHDASKEVIVRAVFDEHTLRIEVLDTGEGFVAPSPEPSVAELTADRRTGGLGLRMMRSLMDEVSYEIVPGEKNRLRMIKRLRS